jgi:hypothetical protein
MGRPNAPSIAPLAPTAPTMQKSCQEMEQQNELAVKPPPFFLLYNIYVFCHGLTGRRVATLVRLR